MSTGFTAFSDLPGKARGLVRKRPLELLFIFASLALAASLVSAYKANASRVSLEIEGPVAAGNNVKTYGVSLKNSVVELQRRGGAWVTGDGEYVRALLLALPKGGLAGLTKVRAGLGNRVFEFSTEDFSKFGLLRLGAVENREWDIYELPWAVRDHKSLFPNFSPLNWLGDASFCAGAALRFALYSLCLLLILALLDPAFFSGLGAGSGPAGGTFPAKAGALLTYLSARNRTVWSSGAGAGSPSLDLGRPFHLALVFLLTAGVVGVLSVLQVDPHHDGVMLKPAYDVASGQALFRDTFTQYGALTVWVQAAAVKAAGASLLTIRLLTALTFGLIAVLMWLIYSRFLPNYLNTFSCLSWLFLGYFFLNFPSMYIVPSATVFAVCATLLSLHLLLLFLESGSLAALSAAGFVTALTFWFKINYGAASFLAALLFLAIFQLREERRRAAGVFAAFFGGCLAAHALFFGWLAAHGSLRDFFLQSVRFALAFTGTNTFATPEPAAVRVLKSLFQVDSPHGGISYLWLTLPIASCAVFLRSAWKSAAGKDTSGKNWALLAVSCAALGLWLGYYPVSALYHMYLSSVVFFGLLSYLVLAAAARLGFAGNRLLILAILTVMFLPDFSYRLRSFMGKTAWYSSWERIETPAFLRGIYVPAEEKKAFAEMDRLIRGSRGRLINLTTGGLYSLYKDDGPNFHKMYMDWGWINSFLYPDYLPAVARQLLGGEGCIISHDTYMIPGYIPAKVFPVFTGGETTARPVVLLLPGRHAAKLRFEGVDSVLRPRAYDRLPLGYRFRLKAGKVPPAIDSVVVKITSKSTVRERIPRYEYEYELLPKLFDPAARELVKKSYVLDPGGNEYAVAGPLDGPAAVRLLDALSGAFLYEKNSFLSDTFLGSSNPKVWVYRNGKPVGYGDFVDGAGYRAGDRIDLVAPAMVIADSYVARLRVNYKGGEYQEEKIVVSKRQEANP